jgi:methylenetetrahydrofolate--tRNA-(uracil-5-)-methyltransferase
MTHITIIGGGLAGSEAAFQLAERGHSVKLYEMRGVKGTAVHKTDKLAELVCSNSFRGSDPTKNAVAVLHSELRGLGSVILEAADATRLPAGGALAMDRELFSDYVTDKIMNHPGIEVIREEVTEIPTDHPVIIATGPLTSEGLAQSILAKTGESRLSFFDAVAPILTKESVNMDICWMQSRYDKGDGKDYINCPMTKEQYYKFIEDIQNAEQAVGHNPEDEGVGYFDGCLPIEVMAERGPETLRFGPMKPKGLTNPHNPTEKPYAIVQLRQDNKLGTLYNMVGFQTRMKWGAQKEVLKTIPGLENADIVRFGVIHKNTFINSPAVLDSEMRLKAQPNVRFAGQVTGVEGYVESTAMGLLAAIFLDAELKGESIPTPPDRTMLGALISHITGGADAKTFQPMNVNYGLLPMPDEADGKVFKKGRKEYYGVRAGKYFEEWHNS